MFWTVTRSRRDGPAAGGLLMRMPPQDVIGRNKPGPFPVTKVFRMSKPAPSSWMPPPGLLATVTWFRRRVAPDDATQPATIDDLMLRSRTKVSPPIHRPGAIVPVIAAELWPTIESSRLTSAMGPLAETTAPRTTIRFLVAEMTSGTPFIEHSGRALLAMPVSEHEERFST